MLRARLLESSRRWGAETGSKSWMFVGAGCGFAGSQERCFGRRGSAQGSLIMHPGICMLRSQGFCRQPSQAPRRRVREGSVAGRHPVSWSTGGDFHPMPGRLSISRAVRGVLPSVLRVDGSELRAEGSACMWRAFQVVSLQAHMLTDCLIRCFSRCQCCSARELEAQGPPTLQALKVVPMRPM